LYHGDSAAETTPAQNYPSLCCLILAQNTAKIG